MKTEKLMQLLRDNATTERRPCNLVRNEAASEASLYIYDVIDAWWGVSALEVAPMVAALDPATTLHVRVNSPGGDVFEGRAIRTALQQFKGKTIGHIDGWAASAATTVVDACDEIEISEGGFYMIHNGWTIALGNRHEMRRTADLLEKVDAAIVADYGKRTGIDAAQLAQWMDSETWFNADETVEHGFANRLATIPDKTPSDQASRTWNLSAYANAPKPAQGEPGLDQQISQQLQMNRNRLRLFQI